jgi:hypothetical protein
MAVLKPRSRSISIRLSEEEFLTLKQLCSVTGARSVSDLTRDAMRLILNGANRDDVITLRLDELRTQIKHLDRKIDELASSPRNNPASVYES